MNSQTKSLIVMLTNIILITLHIFNSAFILVLFLLMPIYFLMGFFIAAMQTSLKKAIILQLICVLSAISIGTLLFIFSKFFSHKLNVLNGISFNGFFEICGVAFLLGELGALLNFLLRKIALKYFLKSGS